ncbi:MAG: hypothetical protein JW934_00130 [Anaerolineae bacterium]|nr:hypothetical protein [Anaerolineae bacterium]
MRNKFVLLSGLLILALLTMGCGVCSMITDKGKEVALTKVVEEVEKKVEEMQTPEPDEENDDDVEAGGDTLGTLGTLESYRYELSLESTEGDQVTKMVGHGAYVQDPPASEMYVETTQADKTDIIHMIQLDDQSFFYDNEQGGWIVFDAQGAAEEVFEMNTLVNDEYIDAFKLEKKSARVNDHDCRVYKADAKDLPNSTLGEGIEITGGTVRVWVSKKLNVMIRYEADISGTKSDGTPVTTKMAMDILDANKPVKIAPPPEDEIIDDMSLDENPLPPTVAAEPESDGVAKSLPKPDDASELTGVDLTAAQAMAQSGDYDLYQTGLVGDEAVEFFEAAYAEAGWTKDETASMSMEGMAVLTFKKDGQTANMIINGMMSPGTSLIVVYVQ